MTAPVHLEIEVLYEALFQPLCENAAGRDAFESDDDVGMTTDPTYVTCRKCLLAMGYEAAEIDRLTICEPDPLRRVA
jgi:hypothetical protein